MGRGRADGTSREYLVSSDRTKTIESARRAVAKGQLDRAVELYQRLLEEDAHDVRTWLKVGDLLTQLGRLQEACDSYRHVAQVYEQKSMFQKAVAVYRQVLKLDEGDARSAMALGELYQKLELLADAGRAYDTAAWIMASKGNESGQLEALAKSAEVSGNNVAAVIKYAEALSRADRKDDAARAFAHGAAILRDAGNTQDFVKVAERLLYHRPSDVEVARELARIYLDHRDPKRALSKLQLSFKADPRDVETLGLLCESFQQLDQPSKAASVLKEVARIHRELGDDSAHRATMKRIARDFPDEAEALSGRSGVSDSMPKAPPQSAVIRSMPPATQEGPRTESSPAPDFSDGPLSDPPGSQSTAPRGRPLPGSPDSASPSTRHPTRYSRVHTTDSDMPSKEGTTQAQAMHGAAVESIRRDLAKGQSQPADEVIEELGDDLLEPVVESPAAPSPAQPAPTRARVAKLLNECDVFAGYGLYEKSVSHLREILDLSPGHVEARERLKEAFVHLGNIEGAIEQLYALSALFEDDKPEVSRQYLEQVIYFKPDHEPAVSRLLELNMEGSGITGDVIFIDEDDGDADGLQPVHTLVQDPARSARFEPQEPERAPSVPPVEEADEDRAFDVHASVDEIMEEAEFYVEQGLHSEAAEIIHRALEMRPNHPLLSGFLAELNLSEEPDLPEPARLEPAPIEPALETEIMRELSLPGDASAGSDALDAESVLAQFKKGVQTHVSQDDADTHFDLGIAYKEMGLLDDAIEEFLIASKQEHKACHAWMMVGVTQRERGEHLDAVEAFKRGLHSSHMSENEELGLYFELGTTYEALRDANEAKFYYQKVVKRDGTFRNAAQRLERVLSGDLDGGAGKDFHPFRD